MWRSETRCTPRWRSREVPPCRRSSARHPASVYFAVIFAISWGDALAAIRDPEGCAERHRGVTRGLPTH
jgi:hypothetical protein